MRKKINVNYGLENGKIYIKCSSETDPDYAQTRAKAIFNAVDALFMDIAKENLEHEWQINERRQKAEGRGQEAEGSVAGGFQPTSNC